MTYEQAIDLFYNNEEIQDEFDFWEMDYAISTVRTLIDDIEEICKEKGIDY